MNINNSTGVTGVYWSRQQKRWHAKIGVNYKMVHLGSFATFEDAVYARLKAEKEFFKEFSPSQVRVDF
jgi:AP2 domain